MIVEATSVLTFKITQAHINRAKTNRRDPNYCVIAQALRAMAGVVAVYVGASFTKITYSTGKTVRYVTPRLLKEHLTYWDRTNGWKLPTGTYELHPPKPHLTRAGIRKATAAHKVRLTRGIAVYNMSKEDRKPMTNARRVEYLRKKVA